MARSQSPCMVPGCKGSLEAGKRDGKTVEWCPVCERRIAQLQQLHEKLDAMAKKSARPDKPKEVVTRVEVDSLSDEDLLKLVGNRLVSMSGAVRLSKRAWNVIRHAIRSKQVPSAMIGRTYLVPKVALLRWSADYVRGGSNATVSLVAALPRSAETAITAPEWSKRVGSSPSTVYSWANAHRLDARLQRKPVFGPNGRTTVAFWWQEASNA